MYQIRADSEFLIKYFKCNRPRALFEIRTGMAFDLEAVASSTNEQKPTFAKDLI